MPLFTKTAVEQSTLLLIGKHLLTIIDGAIAPQLVAVGIDGIHTVIINGAVAPQLVAVGIDGIHAVVVDGAVAPQLVAVGIDG
ncbi:MAG: hypothetical protein RIQ83_909, partial [Pseudomonadota bacterium]